MTAQITGTIFVVGDNIDTDQIIPAQYLNLVPTIAEEYEQLGRYALAGLPEGYPPFVPENETKSPYPVIIAGRNFGCGSSREHAPVSLGAAGVNAVIAESFARIFFRNCVATGELYPVETGHRLCDSLQTGQQVTLDIDQHQLTLAESGHTYTLNPLGDLKEVIDYGGLFNYARHTGMIAGR